MTEIEALKSLENRIARFQSELSDKPQPLLIGGLQGLGFSVIISDEVPDNQIWFATGKQLQEALKYSKRQIENAAGDLI